jgi:hypothetical protein
MPFRYDFNLSFSKKNLKVSIRMPGLRQQKNCLYQQTAVNSLKKYEYNQFLINTGSSIIQQIHFLVFIIF